MSLAAFIEGYLDCAEWAVNGQDADILEFDVEEAKAECAAFYSEAGEFWDGLLSDEQAGHDFYLTRNGHGAGFWSRGMGDVGDMLTAMAKAYGETA